MAPFQKHLTPLSKKGSVKVHKGKGAVEHPLMPSASTGALPTFGQNYGKPEAMVPQDDNDADDMPTSQPGMGSMGGM